MKEIQHQQSANQKKIRIILPLLVIAVSLVIVKLIFNSKPVPEKRRPTAVKLAVEVITALKTDFQITIATQGTVQPRTESTLIPEVSGSITAIAANFTEGGFFEMGDTLLQIDSRDYQAEVVIAESRLAEAQLAVAEETAQAEQALRNWQRLNKSGTPTALVLRKPQLAKAKAAMAAAQAQLQQKKTDLQRTTIKAPYACRILEKNADLGQYVAPGTILAKIFAIDYFEVRLPLANNQLDHVFIPEQYRGEYQQDQAGSPVELQALYGRHHYIWNGRIVRSEASVDTKSRQLYVVARIDNPYQREGSRPPLKVGQYVEAAIKGRTLNNVFVVPRAAVKEGREVFLVDDENFLVRRSVETIWKDQENIIVRDGLKEGERISLTLVSFGTDKLKVEIIKSDEKGPAL